MRRYGKIIIPHKLGDTRTFTQFLLWPKTIGNETRWLETAVWEERCHGTGGEINPRFSLWHYTRWISR